MRLDHQFTVPATTDEAWKVLLDLQRVAPCMPGATLSEFDGETFSGTVKVKLGPVSLTYRGQGRFASVDEAAHRVVIEASGKESRGSGTAAATVTATLTADGSSTQVDVGTDLTITGRPAQFGRGMLHDVGDKLLGQFAACLAENLAGTSETAKSSTEPVATEPSTAGATTTASSHRATTDGWSPSLSREPRTDDDTEPIDLLEVTGAQTMLRRYGPPAAAGGAALALVWLLVRRVRRRRSSV